MRREHEVIRFLLAQQEVWHGHFPGLVSRAQELIVDYLCTKARSGSLVRQLYGVTKEMFLLDDSTVRDRITAVQRLGWCVTNPPDDKLTGRTIIAPTASLIARHEAYLQDLAKRLCTSVNAMERTAYRCRASLTERQRTMLKVLLETCTTSWLAAADSLMAEASLSPARRAEARRHLMSTSHWTLLNRAIAHSHAEREGSAPADGMVADQLAAAVLELTGQSFQTTRDHITYLTNLGLLERRPGKSLRIALSAHAVPFFDRMLATLTQDLIEAAQRLDSGDGTNAPAEITMMRRPPPAFAPVEPDHYLVMTSPPGSDQRFKIDGTTLTFGRLPPSDVVLESGEVSRAHCQVQLVGNQLEVTDLRSTNGTFVDGLRIDGTTTLQPGALVQIGPYGLIHEVVPIDEAGLGLGTIRVLPTRK